MSKEQKRKNLSAEESLERMQEFAKRNERFVATVRKDKDRGDCTHEWLAEG